MNSTPLTTTNTQLLGLQLLGFGFGGGATSGGSRASALARNSSQSSSLLSPTGASSTLSPNQVYKHPIAYDKLTGATNNQINDVLGGPAKSQGDYPIDHYQQQLLQQQQQQHQQRHPLNHHQLNQDEFFGPPPPLMPPPPPPHPHGHHMNGAFGPGVHRTPQQMDGPPMHQLPHPHLHPSHPHNMMGRPPPPPNHLMTTQAPQEQAPRSMQFPLNQPPSDSVPSASSLTNMTQQQQQQHQQQPAYYTPPIFAYNSNSNNNNYEPQQPPVGVPEVPLSIDEYNARQSRYQQQPPPNIQSRQQQQQPVNLLADPQAQQRHKQQMLDRQLLFGQPNPFNNDLQIHHNHPGGHNQTAAAYYPDPALYHQQRGQLMRAPYAHQVPPSSNVDPLQQNQFDATRLSSQGEAQNRILAPPPPPPSTAPLQSPAAIGNQRQLLAPVNRSGQQQQAALPASSASQQQSRQPQQVASESQTPASSVQPSCVRQQQQQANLIDSNNSSASQVVLFCNEDSEYPTREIMRALEGYAAERTIEQVLPQQLIQMLVQQTGPNGVKLNADLQRQLALDSLQADLNSLTSSRGVTTTTSGDPSSTSLFPSASYESMCKSLVYLGQPRRARNLLGQWKVVVNLPGHKYRGIAISQMVRIEECSRPNSECQAPSPVPVASSTQPTSPARVQGAGAAAAVTGLPRTRCLQHYENQRLLSWSHQQGLHLDIFRVPSACSCHIRR